MRKGSPIRLHDMPAPVRPVLRRLARRLALGLFLDVWPRWASASLLIAGVVALVCRMFVARAASNVHWLWLAPVVSLLPATIICFIRSYRPGQVVAIADWLSGGRGLLLTITERDDPAWRGSALVEETTRFALPRLRPWRKLAMMLPAAAFLAAALALPQRVPRASNAVLADQIAADLASTMAELKQQELITPAEEDKIEAEIERIRQSAHERVDGSSWEASDALRERVAAGLSEKQDAAKWAEESLNRYVAAAQAGAAGESDAKAAAAELTQALEKLAQSGLLAGAPPDLLRRLENGKLPADPAAARELVQSLSKYLAEMNQRFADLSKLGKEFGRFDPAEFPLAFSGTSPDGDGNPGRGGINRGRGDAPLTWGKESLPFDRFKAAPLPPGAARSPDDWAPIVEMQGPPQESPELSVAARGRQYAATAGHSAWRRSLAPRHQSAVKKYFEK